MKKKITFLVILWECDITFWSYLLPSSSQIHTLLSTPHFVSPFFLRTDSITANALVLWFFSVFHAPLLRSSLALAGVVNGLIGVAHPTRNWSLHFDQWQLREAASICCKTKFLWWGMTAPLICGQKERNSECSWLYRCRNVDASPPGSTSLAASRKWLRLHCQAWLSSLG